MSKVVGGEIWVEFGDKMLGICGVKVRLGEIVGTGTVGEGVPRFNRGSIIVVLVLVVVIITMKFSEGKGNFMF